VFALIVSSPHQTQIRLQRLKSANDVAPLVALLIEQPRVAALFDRVDTLRAASAIVDDALLVTLRADAAAVAR
jgi:hypothetical protein